ncbi:helicase, putative [Trypanosoma brucei gambiense DAL972]|uniref:Helicase, putative n=2 Tax=Trypanosoma brucei TaxID=5691 RepID=C9ZQA9_TRYB9|nr:helicase, putative [Trypanosoma brucei gambiense DAL972]CBH11589.1 helicase, putative [Trypanosoma brucei gambiense DAL972]|eukprot:XP_011773874.1 helicase, putative [Trypanosoma brucei gambiense DAL972]
MHRFVSVLREDHRTLLRRIVLYQINRPYSTKIGSCDNFTRVDNLTEATEPVENPVVNSPNCTEPTTDLEGRCDVNERTISSKNGAHGMSKLLETISKRKKPKAGPTVGVFPKPVGTMLAEIFTSTAKSNTPLEARGRVVPKPRAFVAQGKPVVSSSLISKLRENVLRKQMDWQCVAQSYPSLQRLGVWQKRSEWTNLFLANSAVPLPPASAKRLKNNGGNEPAAILTDFPQPVTDVFVCNAPTGSGKSSLVPLFLLDSHWQRMLQRIDISHKAKIVSSAASSSVIDSKEGVMRSVETFLPPSPFPVNVSTREYATVFGASSRLCIIVSQPTRLACVELAKFTAAILASSSSTPAASNVGDRVGYAVGGDSCFSAASEIIYATPGYILNALQHDHSLLSHTTLIIDEAHCRDMETDLLLAWAKQQLLRAYQREHGKDREQSWGMRHLILMSATLSAEQMVSYLIGAQFSAPPSEATRNLSAFCKPYVLSLGNEAAQPPDEVSDVAVRSGLAGSGPYRLEEYFIDDLPSALESSQLLGADEKSADNGSKGVSSLNGRLCPLLLPPARRVMASLVHFFSYIRFSPEIHSPQARALAQFVLFTLQSIASLASCRSKPHTTEGSGAVQEKGGITQDQNNEQPESILVFLPGFAEMSLVLQSLEVLCRKTLVNDEGTNDTQRHAEPAGATTKISGDSTMNYAYDNAGSGNVTFLEYEGCSFSVALLHATAVGSPQRQLRETTSPFPYRIILSTNVAESSVTIPNVRCVVDSCLERRFFSDPLTGVTLRSTAVVSVSSSRQRAGRAGRTCDSFVIRLAPRRMFTLQKEVVGTHYGNCGQEELVTSDEKGDDGKVKDNRGEDNESGKAFFLTSHQRSLSGLVPAAPAHTIPESAAANVASLLLRVKYLFPHQASSLLLLLPDAPKPKAIAQGIRQLLDLGLLQCSKSPKQRSGDDVHCIGDSCLELSKDMPRLIDLYNDVCLTAKGEFVSYFPIPHEQALMLYYALQFACIEDAILIACAMTVPTLLLYPRVSVQVGDSKSCEGAPAAQYLQSLLIQRSTASKIGERGKSTSGHTLSEPLMLLSILYEWYACTSSADVVAFFRKFRVNGRALRTVDSSVAQCALRLWRLVTQGSDSHETVNKEKAVTSGVGGGDKDDVFALYGEHDRVERRPSASLIKQLVLSTFPESYRVLLANSLLRLHRCALEHSAHRPSSQHRTMTQWYTQDEQLIRKLQPQLPRAPKQNQRSKKPLLTFGHVQDRLCAAFVAAFARNTMRGEDASHRAHQRRMLRNLGALQEDADRTCSFSVELHSDQRHQQSLLERLTPEVLRDVITPYLADTNVQQIELFSTRRSGVVRFGSEVNGSVDGDRRGGNSGKEEDRLLSAVALPCDPAGLTEAEKGRNLAAVVLAPIGISLLVSIQNVLTRLVAMLPPTSPPASSAVRLPGEQDRNDGETESIRRAEAHEKVASLDRSLPVPGIRTVNRTFSLRFTETEGDSSAASDTCVTWHDSYGREHSLLLSDARRMGYEEFFPQPIAAAAADADHEDCSICRSTGNGVILSGEPVPAPGVDEDVSSSGVNSDGSDEQHALLSIHRVTFTGAVQWKVTLPTVRPSQHEYHSCEKEEGETAPCNKDYYCYVCHNLWFREKSFHHHCRSVTHLTRLSFAVQFGMRREWVGSFCSGTLSDLLLRKRGTNSVSSIGCSDVAVELRSCNVSPLSFLNALQWRPRGEGGTAMLPMAVAGTLIGNAPSYTVTRAAPIKDSGMTLQALHVWVLDTERPGASTEPAGSELPPSLFVLAGYLAAASTGFDAALLTNTAHTRAHAVMLHDWGVWRFPTPLSVQKLKSVMRVYAGKPWRGVPVDADDECEAGGTATDQSSESGNRCRKDDAGGACEEESLHWCVVSDVCPQCTYSGSGGKGRQTRRGILKVVLDDDAPSVDEVVQSTLLIVLHEYQNSLRNVVSFADYIQRVVAKLNAWSNAQQPQLRPPAAAAAVGHCPGAELLARLVASRRGQSIENLLRDIGCQFLSPPSTLVAMGDVDGTIIPTKGVPRVNTGGTNEKLFLIPTVLPSYLPSPNLAELLRRHRVDIRNFHAHAACDFNATSQVGGAAEPEKGTLSRSLQVTKGVNTKQGHGPDVLF